MRIRIHNAVRNAALPRPSLIGKSLESAADSFKRYLLCPFQQCSCALFTLTDLRLRYLQRLKALLRRGEGCLAAFRVAVHCGQSRQVDYFPAQLSNGETG